MFCFCRDSFYRSPYNKYDHRPQHSPSLEPQANPCEGAQGLKKESNERQIACS